MNLNMSGNSNKTTSTPRISKEKIDSLLCIVPIVVMVASIFFLLLSVAIQISSSFPRCESYKISPSPHSDINNSEYWIHEKEYQSEDPAKQTETHDEIILEGKEGEGKRCKNKEGEVTSDEVIIPAKSPKIKRITTGIYKEPLRYIPYTSPQYSERTGAICRDGAYSYATGRGACSWHGGVAQWVYE